MTLLRHHLMAYAAEDVIVENSLLSSELAQLDMVFCCLQTVCRHLMIEEEDDLVWIPDPGIPTCNLAESLHCQGAGDIMNHGAVDVRHDELARFSLFFCRSG